jgi:HSP90 family molecular chaperone
MTETLVKGLRLGAPTNPLVMTLIEFEGHRLLDIRKYFIERTSKTLKPTKKGVSLNANHLKQVQDVINKNAESIFRWLERGDESALSDAERAMAARTRAAEDEAIKPHRLKIREQASKGAEFFSCHSQGAEDILTLNSDHPFFEKMKSSNQHGDSTALLLLLAAYYRAKLRFSGSIETNSEFFFGLLESEWGMLLRNYCQHPEVFDHA